MKKLMVNFLLFLGILSLFTSYSMAESFGGPLRLVEYRSGSPIEKGVLYSIIDSRHSMSEGIIMMYVGETRGLMGREFRLRLESHVELVAKTMQPYGQLKYYVYATDDREFALIQWPSKEVMESAFNQAGETVRNDAKEFLNGLLWEEVFPEDIPEQITAIYVREIIKRAGD